MKITVKVLKGEECTFEVIENTSIKEVKQIVSRTLNVPVNQQKLLLTGRPLSDEKSLLDYPSIKDGTRLNLVIKKSEDDSVLRNALVKFLSPRFSEACVHKIADEFMKEFYRSMGTLNLEDIEKIASSYLEEEKSN